MQTIPKVQKIKIQCCATVYRRANYSQWHGGVHERGQCERAGRVALMDRDGGVALFCRQHAKLALDGFVSGHGETLRPEEMADYRRQAGTIHGTPPYRSTWAEVERKKEQ